MSRHAILTPEAHRDLRIRTDRSADLGDAVMSALVMPDEFRRAQSRYPILFRLDDRRENLAALALFGFENGENLFLDHAGWEPGYLPLAVDIQPFLIGGTGQDDGPKQVHVDLDSPRIAPGSEGERLFDEDGRPTAYLETVIDKLGALDEAYRASSGFFAALRRYDLLEPLSVEVTLDDGSIHRLVGFDTIDEGKLRALDAAALGDLHDAGHLMPIFMAVASLGRLRDLIDRKNRRIAYG